MNEKQEEGGCDKCKCCEVRDGGGRVRGDTMTFAAASAIPLPICVSAVEWSIAHGSSRGAHQPGDAVSAVNSRCTTARGRRQQGVSGDRGLSPSLDWSRAAVSRQTRHEVVLAILCGGGGVKTVSASELPSGPSSERYGLVEFARRQSCSGS